MSEKSVKKMLLTAMFAAMSVVLYIFPKFPLPIFPGFLEVNFSMLPIIICGFALGPVNGLVCVVLRSSIKMLVGLSTTLYVGECMDLLLGGFTVVAVAISFKHLKLKNENAKGIVALVIGTLTWVVAAIFLNVFFSIPFYSAMFGFDNIIKALNVIPGVTESNYLWKYVLYAVVPFNLMLSVFVCLITFFVHRKIRLLYED